MHAQRSMDTVAGAAPAAPATPVQSGEDRPVLAEVDGGRTVADAAIALRTADRAIEHVLNRIHSSPEVGYYMGYGTESFERLCEAYAGIHGTIYDDVADMFRPLNPRDPTKALNAHIDELQERLSGSAGHSCHDDEPAEYGPQNLSAVGIMERVQELLGLYSKDPERCVREIAALYDATALPIDLVTAP